MINEAALIAKIEHAIMLKMQLQDFGHLNDEGDFVCTPKQILLLEKRCNEAARAAILAYEQEIAKAPVSVVVQVLESVADFAEKQAETYHDPDDDAAKAFRLIKDRLRGAALRPQPADVGALREALERTSKLVALLTLKQVIGAGDEAMQASGLNPWCLNEGLARPEDLLGTPSFIEAALSTSGGAE